MADTNHPLNDDAIGRALREALDVSPSPDFVARVRMRIANEPAPRSVWSRWTMWTPVAAGALVAAAVVMMMVVGPMRKIDTGVRPGVNTAAGPSAQAGTDVALPGATVHEPNPEVPPVASSPGRTEAPPVRTRIDVVREPEVLIAQDEAAALRRLFARAGDGLVSGGSPAAEPGEATDIADVVLPPDITIAPLKIEPLVPVNGEEGVRQ